MTKITPQPVKLPIATRAWCQRDEARATPKLPTLTADRSIPGRPIRFIVLGTDCVGPATQTMPGFTGERWAPEGQGLLFGWAAIGRTYDWRIRREIIFYPDDLPKSGVNLLRRFIEERTYRLGAPARNAGDAEPDLVWRDQRDITVKLLPLSQFLKLFYRIAYNDRSLVIGDGLPFVLSRLAAEWHETVKGKNVGAWRLTLWTYPDAATGEQRAHIYRPFVDIKHVNPDVNFIEFSVSRPDKEGEKAPRYRGEFLDVSNLAHTLTGRHWTLEEACKTFTGEFLDPDIDRGLITPEAVIACRTRVRATVSLADTLLDLFDRLHPVSRGRGGHLSETHLYSPGGLARGYLKSAGFAAPIVQHDRLGACVAASFGGLAENELCGRAPVIHVDFRRQYQTVFLLQELQTLLAAERLDFVDDTAAVREFIERTTLDDLRQLETWPDLNALCWVRPAGEILPIRAAFNERAGADRFTMALVERHSDEPIVLYLGDVAVAKLRSGRALEIVHAERIVPVGRQQLHKTRLFGGAVFDPGKDDQLFKILVEEGERFNRGEGRYADIPDAIRAAILPGLKATGNIGCYGALSETRAVDLLPGRREEVTLMSDGEPLRATVAHPEEPGPFACPPIAGLVSAGGRLLLAMVHRMVADAGGVVAACDTDGAHIVATPKGDTLYIDTRGEDSHEGGTAQPIHALSRADVEAIAARFEPLNPFDRSLLPGSPLRIKVEGDGLFRSPKRYSATGPDGSFIDYKESILGMLVSSSAGFIEEAWQTIGELCDFAPLTPRPWFDLPAVRSLALISPAYARQLKGLVYKRPWNRFLAATAICRVPGVREPITAVVVAPFEPDPEKWETLLWRFAESGELVPLGQPDAAGRCWRLRTLRQFVESYARHTIPEMLTADGSRCGPYTRGLLRRRPVRDGERWLILKEAAVFGDDPQNAFSLPAPETIRPLDLSNQDRAGAWETAIKPALILVGPATVAKRMSLAPRTGRSWAMGEREPAEPAKVARTIVAIAQELGLGFATDELHRSEEICADLPMRAALVQYLIAAATQWLAKEFGGRRGLARAMQPAGESDHEPTLRRWIALGSGEVQPIAYLNGIMARLAKFCRGEIRKKGRRFTVESGPAGDRQVVWSLHQLLTGANTVQVPSGDETLIILPALVLVASLAALGDALRGADRPAASA